MEILIADRRVVRFLQQLDHTASIKVTYAITLLEKFGSDLRLPHSQYLGHGMFELRIRGSIDIRLFYCFKDGHAVIVHAIKKKSLTIPLREYQFALKKIRSLDKT